MVLTVSLPVGGLTVFGMPDSLKPLCRNKCNRNFTERNLPLVALLAGVWYPDGETERYCVPYSAQ